MVYPVVYVLTFAFFPEFLHAQLSDIMDIVDFFF